MKICFKTEKILLNNSMHNFFENHASFENIDTHNRQIVKIDEINEEIIEFIYKHFLEDFRSFLTNINRFRFPCEKEWKEVTEENQTPMDIDELANYWQKYPPKYVNRGKNEDYVNMLTGKTGEMNCIGIRPVKRNNEQQAVFCKTTIDNNQHIQFHTDYEFESPELLIDKNYTITVKSGKKEEIDEQIESIKMQRSELKYETTVIKLEPQPKLIYLLFLNHPEGIKLGDIRKEPYKNEIINTYKKLSNREDKESILKKIFDINNSQIINEIKTRINKEIKLKANDYAEFYQISGKKNQRYSIKICQLYPELVKMI